MSAPAMLSLVTALIRKTSIPTIEAWNTRLSIARWYNVSIAEIDGADIKVAYDDEERFVSTLSGKSESEIVAIAKENMPKDSFRKWQSARRSNKK